MQKQATVHLTGDNIMVRRAEQTTESGITKVSKYEDPNEALQGTVAARGPGVATISGQLVDMVVMNASGKVVPLALGDGVIYRVKDANEIRIASGTYDVVQFSNVIAVLKVEQQGDNSNA